jgi:hypothetical protein
MLIIVFLVCCAFSIISVITPSSGEEPDPKPEPTPAPALAPEEKPEMSFSTSAALTAEREFVVPQVRAGRIPVDCVLTDWQNVDGDTCNSTGQQKQKKDIITEAKDGGKECPDAESDERKRTINCDVDCVQTETWSGCNKSTGTKNVTRTTTQRPWNNGAACKPATATENCVVDCELSGEKDVNRNICTAYCGGGSTWSYKSIITTPKNGGQACPSRAERTIRKACPAKTCYTDFTNTSTRVDVTHDKSLGALVNTGEFGCKYKKLSQTRSGGVAGFKLVRDKGGYTDQIYYETSCKKWPGDGTDGDDNRGTYKEVSSSIANLHKVEVDCGEYPISQLQFVDYNDNPNATLQRIKYACSRTPCYSRSVSRTTDEDTHGNEVVYLDRHSLQCPDGYLMTKFKVEDMGGNKIQYNYSCCRMPDSVSKSKENGGVDLNEEKLGEIFDAEDAALGITTT